MANFFRKLIKTGLTLSAVAGTAAIAYRIAKKAVKVTVNNNDSEEIDETPAEPETAEDSLFGDDEISGEEADDSADRHYVNIKLEDEKKDVNIDIDMKSIREEAGKLKDEAVNLTKTIIDSVKSTASDISEKVRDSASSGDDAEDADLFGQTPDETPEEPEAAAKEPQEGSEEPDDGPEEPEEGSEAL